MNKETTFQEGESAEVKGSPNATTLTPGVPETLRGEVDKKKDPEAFKAMFKKVGKISVKPYIDPNMENMGLEDYGMAVFPGIHHEEQLAAIERNGVIRYITGLDEFAPEVQNINDNEQRDAVIYNIRSVVIYLEKTLATNVIKDIEDEEFWNKVTLLRPDNYDFWSQISLRVGNDSVYLNPTEDPYDLIKLMAIEAGGFDIVCKGFEDAMAQAVPPKFYLDKEVQTVSSKTTYKKLRNKAISLLDKMSDKNSKKLMYVAKILDSNSASYKMHTPSDILYDALDEFINGNGVENNKSRAAEMFIETAKLDMETLKLKAIVKDASFYKIISLKPDGVIYHTDSSTMLGRNVSDVVLYLKNPLNEDILIKLMGQVEDTWTS